MNFGNLKFKTISKKIWAVLLFFSRHIILSCLLIVLISIGIGFYVFYINIALVSKENFESMNSSLDIRKDYYDQIVKLWDEENKRKEESTSKSFVNFFYNISQPSPSPSLSPSPKPSPEETP